MRKTLLISGLLVLLPFAVFSQTDEPKEEPPPTVEELRDRLEDLEKKSKEESAFLEALRRLRITGYIQAQYVRDDRSSNETTGASGTRNLDQFSVRRGRLKFTYQAAKTSRFVLQPEIASAGVSLKDAYIELTEPWTSWRHTLTAGQFKWPFGFEIFQSSSAREMPERSLVVRSLFPGERDRGAMLSGKGLAGRFHYTLALVNGTGTTQAFDFNKRKDLVGRAGYAVGSFDVAASIYRGAELVSLDGLTSGREFDKEREGIDFQWVTPVKGLRVRGEYIRGIQPPAPGTSAGLAHPADVAGWYFYAIQNVGARHRLVARIDEYDPDTDSAQNATQTIGGAYLFQWDRNSTMMLAYEQPKRQVDDPSDDVWTLRYQYSF